MTLKERSKKSVDSLKKHKENYHKPTPKKWRKIGDTLMLLSNSIAGVAALMALNPWIVVGGITLGTIGKIITNFTTE